ncbi:MAG TPA: hypothetical protein VHL51_15095 [Gaiellales bacterium]|jgi:hypothetical protein|nr:hypothetical protein [Gaiellales bacterium]
MKQLGPITGRSTTMFRSHTFRVLVLAIAALAMSASAAQARPLGMGFNASSSTTGYHTFYRPAQVTGYHGSYRPIPATRTTPVVVPAAKPAPQTSASAGFDWSAALIGAGIVGVVLLLAAIPASRIRPRRVAQF